LGRGFFRAAFGPHLSPLSTSDKTTLRPFVERIERQYGKARRVWLMDRGVPTEEVLPACSARPRSTRSTEDLDLLKRNRDLGIARMNVRLPPAKADEILPVLDSWAKIIRQLRA
jgi:hypothetical protein